VRERIERGKESRKERGGELEKGRGERRMKREER